MASKTETAIWIVKSDSGETLGTVEARRRANAQKIAERIHARRDVFVTPQP